MKHYSKSRAHNIYKQNAKHTIYAVGFGLNGKEYVVSVKHLCTSWLAWSKKDGKYFLRLRLNTKQMKRLVNTAGCVCLGNTEDVYDSESEYNKGDQLERILYEAMTHKTWHKDYTPWYEGADIEIASENKGINDSSDDHRHSDNCHSVCEKLQFIPLCNKSSCGRITEGDDDMSHKNTRIYIFESFYQFIIPAFVIFQYLAGNSSGRHNILSITGASIIFVRKTLLVRPRDQNAQHFKLTG